MAKLNLDDLTLGEIETIEDELQMTIGQIGATIGQKYTDRDALPPGAAVGDDKPIPTKVARCLAWLVKHRGDPSFTMDAAKDLKASELGSLFDDDSAPPERATEIRRLPDPTAAVAATA